jgi:hypothetical protein
MGTFSGLNPDRTDMRLGYLVLHNIQNTAVLWCQRLSGSPFSYRLSDVPCCLAISVLAPRPLVSRTRPCLCLDLIPLHHCVR